MWDEHQLTEEQAKLLFDSEEWKNLSDLEIVKLQLFQERVCVPWKRFTKAMEIVLKREIQTIEYGYPEHLQIEFMEKTKEK